MSDRRESDRRASDGRLISDRREGDRTPVTLPGQQRAFVERRRKQDWVVKSATVIAILGWAGTMIALLLIDRAAPAQENFITRFLKLDIISTWNTSMLRWAFITALASFLTCVVGLILNATRQRRKTDKYNKLLITVSVISTVLLIFYMVNFFKYLS
ncbi:MAG: hypothetical protein FWG88_09455 [Oscillospiraceae bacterium]|nr:hypothetical protein [Oscillospiraceae bacterium]